MRDRYRIFLSSPIPHMDSGENRAYQVEDLRDPVSRLYAIVVDPSIPYRDEMAQRMTSRSVSGILELHAHGVVQFDDTDYRYVFVFDQPLHGRAFSEGTPLTEQEVLGKIVPRLIDTITDLHSRGLAHRGIRADNLFLREKGRLGLVLGEAVTNPAGSLQPAVYEPLESANAMPHGRGELNPAADVYALGVLIVHLLGGVLPGQGRQAVDLYKAKLQQGTYAVLVPKIQASSRAGFLLAGLLNDDITRRWNLEVLKRWRDGVYERPRPGFGDRRAPGPIAFDDQEFVSPRLLAQALTERPSLGYSILENGKLESWVRNSLNDKEAAVRIGEILTRSTGLTRGMRRNEIQAISRAAAILDHQGALWYRDITFSRGGMGSLLAYGFRKGGALKNTLAELLESGLLPDVVFTDQNRMTKEKKKEDSWMKIGAAADCFEYMEKWKHLGFGLERCLYELNPTLSCLSPSLDGAYVRDVGQLLEILETKALQMDGKINPFDRHIAAFVAARTRSVSKHFSRLAALPQGSIDYTISLLNLFARLQNLLKPGPLPGLSLWFGQAIEPLIQKIHSEMRRELVRAKYERVKDSGNLEKILIELDLKNHIIRDASEYDQAIKAFIAVDNGIEALEKGSDYRKLAAQKYGHWIASVLSISVLFASMGLSYMYFIR
ncbi:hypothetical protein GCM10007924_15800 [Sneathiella chinensis]|uniref:non-specific serine/threonine protein kinase n=1 Tax=Sneathiella chinensis TaxID=349750 RepID=A0ABQ5U371_9PROT|nr:hypothetical protein GCM10007924_15800 [Sneathiella chinensis]